MSRSDDSAWGELTDERLAEISETIEADRAAGCPVGLAAELVAAVREARDRALTAEAEADRYQALYADRTDELSTQRNRQRDRAERAEAELDQLRKAVRGLIPAIQFSVPAGDLGSGRSEPGGAA